ncbi:MAG TPA: ATP-binding protein [Candidatus Nitrosotenuis sp.]|nr:ATP-binding protein [Candidatus Nitrosotenuis sp.]
MSDDAETALWVNRKAELQALCAAIRRRESRLVCGPSDSGKTALLRRALQEIPGSIRGRCCFVQAPKSPHDFLVQFLAQLATAGNRVCRERLEREGVSPGRAAHWFAAQTSVRLRGMMYRCLRAGEFWLAVDDAEKWSPAAGRLLYDVAYRGETPVILLARGFRPDEIGKATRLFWHDGQRIRLSALPYEDANALLDRCISFHALSGEGLSEFRNEVLHASDLLPGGIVKLCRMARLPKYRFGEQIKSVLVRVDYLMEKQGEQFPAVSGPPGFSKSQHNMMENK